MAAEHTDRHSRQGRLRSAVFARQNPPAMHDWSLIGRVATGVGQGQGFTGMDWVRDAFRQHLGIEVYPGTLNLRLLGAGALALLTIMSAMTLGAKFSKGWSSALSGGRAAHWWEKSQRGRGVGGDAALHHTVRRYAALDEVAAKDRIHTLLMPSRWQARSDWDQWDDA